MNTNYTYTFEELFETAESTLMDLTGFSECLPELYWEIMLRTTGLQVATTDSGDIETVKIELRDVGEGQGIVFTCGKQGHTIKIFNNGVEVFSTELDKRLVHALHTLARLEILFKQQFPFSI